MATEEGNSAYRFLEVLHDDPLKLISEWCTMGPGVESDFTREDVSLTAGTKECPIVQGKGVSVQRMEPELSCYDARSWTSPISTFCDFFNSATECPEGVASASHPNVVSFRAPCPSLPGIWKSCAGFYQYDKVKSPSTECSESQRIYWENSHGLELGLATMHLCLVKEMPCTEKVLDDENWPATCTSKMSPPPICDIQHAPRARDNVLRDPVCETAAAFSADAHEVRPLAVGCGGGEYLNSRHGSLGREARQPATGRASESLFPRLPEDGRPSRRRLVIPSKRLPAVTPARSDQPGPGPFSEDYGTRRPAAALPLPAAGFDYRYRGRTARAVSCGPAGPDPGVCLQEGGARAEECGPRGECSSDCRCGVRGCGCGDGGCGCCCCYVRVSSGKGSIRRGWGRQLLLLVAVAAAAAAAGAAAGAAGYGCQCPGRSGAGGPRAWAARRARQAASATRKGAGGGAEEAAAPRAVAPVRCVRCACGLVSALRLRPRLASALPPAPCPAFRVAPSR